MEQDLSPIYLGKSKATSAFFFLAPTKEGDRRFIKYVSYPFWCPSSLAPDFLDPTLPEESIFDEVEKFVAGKLQIEIIPKTRGRAERVIKKEVPVISAQEKSKENTNVANDITQPESNRNDRDSDARGSKEAAESLPKQETHNLNPSRDILSTPSSSEEGSGVKPGRRGRKPDSRNLDTGKVRRLPSNGYGNADGTGISHGQLHVSSAKPRRRLKSDRGVLGIGGDDSKSTPRSSAVDPSSNSCVDAFIKPKRKRRTKLEMQEARAAEAAALMSKSI